MNSAKALGKIVFLSLCWTSTVLADGYDGSGDEASLGNDSVTTASNLDRAAQELKTEQTRLEHAGEEERSAAVGHFARARSHLVAALREFDSGYKIAKPDSILNSKEWREDLISRAEDLERILAPQARASKFGVQYEGDSRLLSTEAKER